MRKRTRKSAEESRKDAKEKLNARLVRQTLRGYTRADRLMQEERRARLERLTIEEARRIFDELHQDAERWKQFGGDIDALERRRTAGKIRGRRIFVRAARGV
jgi:hypothetical protein